MAITCGNITTSNILKNFFVGASGLEVCHPCRLVEQRLSTGAEISIQGLRIEVAPRYTAWGEVCFYYIYDITGGFPYYIKYKKKLSSLDIIISSSDRLSSFFILRCGKSSSYYDVNRNGAGVRPQTHGEAPLSAGVERMIIRSFKHDIYLYTRIDI